MVHDQHSEETARDTRIVRMALNVSWRSQRSDVELYGNIPKVTSEVQRRTMCLAGYCIWHGDKVASSLVHCQPSKRRKEENSHL